jgi:hypothetical protein
MYSRQAKPLLTWSIYIYISYWIYESKTKSWYLYASERNSKFKTYTNTSRMTKALSQELRLSDRTCYIVDTVINQNVHGLERVKKYTCVWHHYKNGLFYCFACYLFPKKCSIGENSSEIKRKTRFESTSQGEYSCTYSYFKWWLPLMTSSNFMQHDVMYIIV